MFSVREEHSLVWLWRFKLSYIKHLKTAKTKTHNRVSFNWFRIQELFDQSTHCWSSQHYTVLPVWPFVWIWSDKHLRCYYLFSLPVIYHVLMLQRSIDTMPRTHFHYSWGCIALHVPTLTSHFVRGCIQEITVILQQPEMIQATCCQSNCNFQFQLRDLFTITEWVFTTRLWASCVSLVPVWAFIGAVSCLPTTFHFSLTGWLPVLCLYTEE